MYVKEKFAEDFWFTKEVIRSICMLSATLVDYEVDALWALTTLVVPHEGLRLPVARVNDVSDALRVLKPPSVAIVAQKVQTYVALGDLQLSYLGLACTNGLKAL